MIIYQALHHEIDSAYAFPLSKNEMLIRLRVAKDDDVTAVNLIYGDKYTYHKKQHETNMLRKYTDKMFAYYEIRIKLSDVRFVYIFKIMTPESIYFYSEDGITTAYDFIKSHFNCFQYPYINESDIMPEITWVKNAVFYEIFVDRFHQGNKKKDARYITLKWGESPKSGKFAGGDLLGIIAKLPYLKELGITAIYLTPIFSSISYHKYDTNDYLKIDPHFGDEKDLKLLVQTAHSMGIRVILDGVFNHASDLLDKFQDVIKLGKKSAYFDWFIIRGDKVDTQEVNYETFSSCYYHPKFNTSNREVQDYLINIGKYYVEEYDIDGWRLDVSDEASHTFWRRFRSHLKKIKEDVFLVGENWHNAANYLRGDEFDSIMNYRFTKLAVQYLAENLLTAEEMKNELISLLMRNKEQANKMMLNLLDSHDTNRFFDDANENKDKLFLALSLLFIFQGVPLIYYGTEIPLSGGYDPDNRRCMDFSRIDSNGVYKLIKQLAELRRDRILGEGDIDIACENGCLKITRFIEDKSIILIINNTEHNKKLTRVNKILLKHNCSDDILMPCSFVIFRGVR